MDKVFIEGLEVACVIGAYEWEQQTTQKLVLDIEMSYSNLKPGNSDCLEDALDYTKVIALIEDYLHSNKIQLLERVAEKLAHMIIEQFLVSKIKITVRKPTAIFNASSVGVSIERSAK